jgi:hypothetical protein
MHYLTRVKEAGGQLAFAAGWLVDPAGGVPSAEVSGDARKSAIGRIA